MRMGWIGNQKRGCVCVWMNKRNEWKKSRVITKRFRRTKADVKEEGYASLRWTVEYGSFSSSKSSSAAFSVGSLQGKAFPWPSPPHFSFCTQLHSILAQKMLRSYPSTSFSVPRGSPLCSSRPPSLACPTHDLACSSPSLIQNRHENLPSTFVPSSVMFVASLSMQHSTFFPLVSFFFAPFKVFLLNHEVPRFWILLNGWKYSPFSVPCACVAFSIFPRAFS